MPNKLFVTAEQAAAMIPDNAVLFASGFVTFHNPLNIYWALHERFRATHKPSGLTLIAGAIAGGAGKKQSPLLNADTCFSDGVVLPAEGPRMVRRFIVTHTGSWPVFRNSKLAATGGMDAHVIPLGVQALALRNMAERGRNTVVLPAGKTPAGTDFDPRTGRGTKLFPDRPEEQMVHVNAHGDFSYEIPWPSATVIAAAAADEDGNIYFKGDPCIANRLDAVRAVKARGGLVLVQVGVIVGKGYGPIDVAAELVDAIVVTPHNEQVAFRKSNRPFSFLLPGQDRMGHPVANVERGLAKLDFLGSLLGLKQRSPELQVAARMAAWLAAKELHEGDSIDIGVGFPEQVARSMFRAGSLSQLRCLVESGVIGGLPAPNAFFGGSLCPKALVRSSDIFEEIYSALDCVIVGCLEADSQGNVNVHQAGDSIATYVGPGGFVDFTITARVVLFCCPFKLKTAEGKFVAKVKAVSFSGQHALQRNQTVYFVSECCVFHLTARGMELLYLLPGNTVEDVSKVATETGFEFVLPPGGKPTEITLSALAPDVTPTLRTRSKL